jgi:hypothetical protein
LPLEIIQRADIGIVAQICASDLKRPRRNHALNGGQQNPLASVTLPIIPMDAVSPIRIKQLRLRAYVL